MTTRVRRDTRGREAAVTGPPPTTQGDRFEATALPGGCSAERFVSVSPIGRVRP
ncbi:hypothetical protein [Streptosporangium oxazolinicum]|uniref:hypothetical protein n=1 Tax=Streptosporangium oxazolinicum TaxID=909287 RepID=UPI0031E7AD7B